MVPLRRPSPLPVRLRIERVVAGGDALSHDASGRVVFVPGALPGELVEVSIRSAKRDFARGVLTAVIEPSPARVAPPCPALARGCGGCDWQHVEPVAQIELKAEIVREALRRTGRLPDAVVEIGAAVEPWGYRTSMRFALDRQGRPALRRSHSNDLVALDSCPVAHHRLSELLASLVIDQADEVSVRVAAADDRSSLWWTPAGGVAAGIGPDVVCGMSARLVERVAGVDLQVSAAAFFQSGPRAAELLVDAVRAAGGVELTAAATVVDAYGGVGLFAATVVPVAAEVVVVEGSAAACDDARVNLAGRRARVVNVAVEDWDPVPADLVIADPSRQGLGEDAVRRLAATDAAVLVLVSCDPVALARDATLLAAAGYRHAGTTVLDLFPQTHHVEAVTRFERAPTR